jgi:hypothetical protein
MTDETETVGNVSFMLGQLKQGMETILKTLGEDRLASAQYRTDIRNEIAGLRKEYHDVSSDLTIVKEKIEKIEPKVEALEQKHDREEGARSFAVSAGSALGKFAQLILGAVGGSLAVVVERWLRGH